MRLTKLIPNAVTDINGGVDTGVDARHFVLTSIVGVGNYYYIPYQINDIFFVSVRTLQNMDIIANSAVGNVRVYYMKR